jgi:hypothetical protein
MSRAEMSLNWQVMPRKISYITKNYQSIHTVRCAEKSANFFQNRNSCRILYNKKQFFFYGMCIFSELNFSARHIQYG